MGWRRPARRDATVVEDAPPGAEAGRSGGGAAQARGVVTDAASQSSPAQPLLSVRDLRTYFVSGQDVVKAVDGVSFDLRAGERMAIVGESGSGKSVTALSILGLVDPPAGHVVGGEVVFEGRDLLSLSEAELRTVRGRRIGYVFQDPMTALDPAFTIGSQLVETIRLHSRISRAEARARAIELLEDVQIGHAEQRLTSYPHQLSGGMRQRVVIALALASSPALLIADEPTTALDVTTQAQILELIFGLATERGTAVLLITHDLGVVAGTCDRVQVMYAGRVVEQGTAAQIFAAPRHPYTWALLRSTVRLDEERPDRLTPVPGAPPSLVDVPPGCPFHPRCAFCVGECRAEVPDWHGVPGDGAACHLAAQLELTPVDRSR